MVPEENEVNTLGIKEKVGGFVSLVAGLINIVVCFYFYFLGYQELMQGFSAAGQMPAAKMLKYMYPVLNEVGVLAGAILIIAAYAFFSKRKWAWLAAVIGAVLGIWSGWQLSIFPLMIWFPMRHLLVFFANLILWVVLVAYIRPAGAKLLALSLFGGMAMILNFMNGTAALNKIIGNQGAIFLVIQQLSYIAFILFAIFCIAVLFRRNWSLPIGLTAALLGVLSGTPVAYLNTLEKQSFSLFTLAPTISLLLLLVLFLFGEILWEKSQQDDVACQNNIAL